MLKRKMLIGIIFISLNLQAEIKIPKFFSLKKVALLENEIEKWIDKTGTTELLQIGRLKHQPNEVRIARVFFPYLLPTEFVGVNIDILCTPILTLYRETLSRKRYYDWRDCLLIQNGGNPEGLLKQALRDLKP